VIQQPGDREDQYARVKRQYRMAREELRDLRAEKEALERDLESMRASVSAAENQIRVIRNSVTFRVGSLVVNSRTLRGAIRLPWRLITIFFEYRQRRGTYNQTSSVLNHEEPLENQYVEVRPDFDQIWIGSDNAAQSKHQAEFKSSEERGLTAAFEGSVLDGLLEFSLPFDDDLPPFDLSKEFVVEVREIDHTGEVFSKKFLPPINGQNNAYEFVGESPLALQFAYHIQSDKPAKILVDLVFCEELLNSTNRPVLPSLRCRQYLPGISVVIPSYQGASTIARCIDSLVSQSVGFENFDVLVVLNGPADGTEELLSGFADEHPDLSLKVMKATYASAGNARNIGLEASNREYITFIDDDDFVSEHYLRELLNACAPNAVAVASVKDVDVSGNEHDNVINQQLQNAKSYSKCQYKDVSSVLTMNACKALPTFLAAQLRYDSSMRSGEDVCYFSRYFTRYSPALRLEPVSSGSVYYRVLSDESVSRRPQSFDFNVKERVAVIQSLDRCVPFVLDKDKKDFLVSKIMAQSNFIRSYLDTHRGEIGHYASLLHSSPIQSGFDNQIAASLSHTLVYSYCFAPAMDTAGIVMAKRIEAQAEPVDVVCNNMDAVRKSDKRLERITVGLVGRLIALKGRPSFSGWPEIRRFAQDAEKAVARLEKSREPYQAIYSRAMWVASHFAAILHKLKQPEVFWRAEFSDPLLKDVHGHDRDVDLDRSWLKRSGILAALKSRSIVIPESNNLFFWAEFLVYVFADEIVFTNANQFDYMMSYSGLPENLKKRVQDRSVIEHHPTLPPAFYKLSDPDYVLDEEALNIAYFGSFYATRGLGEVFMALKELKKSDARRINVHVFTSSLDEARREITAMGLASSVVLNSYVSFIDFLAMTSKFDCLIVNDADTKGVKPVNPYLPSKLSDYMGSGSDIWAICEEGSILHQLAQDDESGRIIASFTGDQVSHLNVLKMLEERKRA